MLDITQAIRHHNAGREAERLAMKYQRLRRDPFTFMRGTCHLFYERLPDERLFHRAPPVWSCGDLHIENFGSYKGDNRLVYFDINDVDEAALAPASWDLVRLLSSMLMAADTLDIKRSQALKLLKLAIEAYGDTLAEGKARWIERDTAQGLLRERLTKLKDRSREDLLDKHTELKRQRRRLRTDGQQALPASAAQVADVTELIERFAARQPDPDFYKVLDVARRVAGTGSLGLARYTILIKGKGAPDKHYLLDLKQAPASSLVPHLKVDQPRWASQAQRIVTLQQRMQAVPMAFLHPIVQRKTSYVLRGLQPSEDRVDLGAPDVSASELEDAVQDMARLTAWAHLRSTGRQGSSLADDLVAFGQSRKKWQAELYSAAQHCARQVHADWRTYCEAFDSGVFGTEPE